MDKDLTGGPENFRKIEEKRKFMWPFESSEKYVDRILWWMRFSSVHSSKNKTNLVTVLRESGVEVPDIPDPEERIWRDPKIKDLGISFSCHHVSKEKVEQLQFVGHAKIQNLFCTANLHEDGCLFGCDILDNSSYQTPNLSKKIATSLQNHPCFDRIEASPSFIFLKFKDLESN